MQGPITWVEIGKLNIALAFTLLLPALQPGADPHIAAAKKAEAAGDFTTAETNTRRRWPFGRMEKFSRGLDWCGIYKMNSAARSRRSKRLSTSSRTFGAPTFSWGSITIGPISFLKHSRP